MHNLHHRSRLKPWLGQHNSMWGKFPHLWHHHPHKYTMHHQCNKFKPPPPLRWDKCSHNKTVPTSLPPTTNKGKLEITGPCNKGNKQPQGGGQQPNPPNNVAANRLAQNPPRQNAPRRNTPFRTNQPCTLCDVYGHYTFECLLMGRAKQAIQNEIQ